MKAGRTRTADTGSVRTLERGLSVLSTLAELREASLTQLARQVELSASTTYRLLETLRQQGFVEWEERSGLFRVGLRAFQVGAAFGGQHSLIQAAGVSMAALAGRVGETVNLAVLRGQEAVYIHQAEGKSLMRMFTQLGAAAPLHCSGVGKVLLAWLPDEQIQGMVGTEPLLSFTPHSITDPETLKQELVRVRADEYALDDEERELGVRCLAVPIWGASRQVVAALSVSAPASRFARQDVPQMLEQVQAATQEISARLGY